MKRFKHYEQRTDFTCGLASLKMVLDSYGFVRSERWYSGQLKPTSMGCNITTLARRRKIKSWGFSMNKIKANSNLEEIARHNEKETPVIAYVSVEKTQNQRAEGEREGHFIVVYDVDDSKVYVADPLLTKNHSMSRADFEREWYDPNPNNRDKREIIVIKKI